MLAVGVCAKLITDDCKEIRIGRLCFCRRIAMTLLLRASCSTTCFLSAVNPIFSCKIGPGWCAVVVPRPSMAVATRPENGAKRGTGS